VGGTGVGSLANSAHRCAEVEEYLAIHRHAHHMPRLLGERVHLAGIRSLYCLDQTRPRCPTLSSESFGHWLTVAWPMKRTNGGAETTRRMEQVMVTMKVGLS
jgi:hypothetical protein